MRQQPSFVLLFIAVFCWQPRDASGQDAEQIAWLVKGTPDPAAIQCRDGSGDYIFATGEGIAIWHRNDSGSWTRIGRVFQDAVPPWAKKLIPKADSIWAPDIQFVKGKYYLYYSVSTFGSQRSVIGLAVNATLNQSDPGYRWQDRGLVLESFPDKNDYNAIDPALLVDGDRGYLVWGSYWTGIKGTEVKLATGKPSSSQPKAIAIAARAPAAPTSIEGAYIVKHDEFYYLFVSWDFCCAREKSTYKVMIGRSRSPLGPYVDKSGLSMVEGGGQLLLMSDQRWRGPGHNSVLQTKDGDRLVYHVVDARAPDRGRILQLRPIEWKNKWPVLGSPVGERSEPEPNLSKLVGRWSHSANRDRYDIFFEPTGEITGTKGRAEWELNGRELLMKWHDANAPGGKWIDRVQLDANHDGYSGKNQTGTVIEGRKRDS